MNVIVNKKAIQSEVKKCDTYIQEFASHLTSLKKKVVDVGNTWKNQEYSQFSSKMNELVMDLEGFQKQLDSCVRFVENYVKAQDMLEKEYKEKKINIE